MSDMKGSDAFKKARAAKYDSPYSRIIANSLESIHQITNVSNHDFNSNIGGAMTSSVQQTIEAMAISDEQFDRLEGVLKDKRASTSSILDKPAKVEEILKEALGENIVSKEQVSALIDSVNNKFENFQKVEDSLKLKNLEGYNKALDVYRDKNAAMTKNSIETGKGDRLIFEQSLSYRVNELSSSAHDTFVSLVGAIGKKKQYATQGIALGATIAGFMTARFVKSKG